MDVLVIFNPRASRMDAVARRMVLGSLGARPGVRAADTTGPGHAAALAAQAAAAGCRLVVAVGGDGTANEAANGLVGTGTALWCLPAGSTNVFARTVGMADRLEAAVAQLGRSAGDPRVVPVSTGIVDGRHFLFMSGIGVTAAVMRRASERPALRARLGAGYVAFGVAAALADARRGRLARVVVEAGGRREEAVTVIVQRSDPLTYFGRRPVRVCPPAALGDGTLSVALADRATPADVASIFARLLAGGSERLTAHRRVRAIERLPELVVRSTDGRPFALEVDGTYVGERTEVRYGMGTEPLLVARA